ncbi:MAG: hypothetical protein QXQ47_04710 [Candidatus Bathyarchaeia archaeon]
MAKATSLIMEADYDTVFVNFPHNLQSIVLSYASERISFRDFVNMVKSERLIPEPVNMWLYLNQPILESLPLLQKRNARIFCYRDVDDFHLSMENASKIANLTLKVNVTGKVDVEEWIKTIRQAVNLSSVDLEAEFIGCKAEGKSICVTDLFGWKLVKRIKEFGHRVSVRCVEKLYYMKPVETLEILLERGKLTPQDAEQLIREHAKFVRDYVLSTENIDEAYFSWLGKRKILGQNAKA